MRVGVLPVALILTACASGEAARTDPPIAAATDTARPWRKPGDVIDSILPMAEYLRRFRTGLTEPVRFEGGASSRDELARRFLAALATKDTAALADLAVTRAEFAWLVFPDHLYAAPPYELDPAFFWMQLGAEGAKGLNRALERYGGRPFILLALACQRDTLQLRSGPARMWSGCQVRYRDGEQEETRRLFGSIVERDGRAKLLSFANDF
jgi:hypothetical protein